jgi:hypothetical protein
MGVTPLGLFFIIEFKGTLKWKPSHEWVEAGFKPAPAGNSPKESTG